MKVLPLSRFSPALLLGLVALSMPHSTPAQCPSPSFGPWTDVIPWTPPAYSPSIWTMDHGDLDGDGRVDVVLGRVGTVTVVRNVGGGAFVVEPEIPCLLGIGEVTLGDFDNDGRLDIAAVGAKQLAPGVGHPVVSVLLNRPNGGPIVHFAPPIETPIGAVVSSVYAPLAFSPVCAVAADFDADGILDLAVGSASLSGYMPTLVALGQGTHGLGTGSFAPPTVYPWNQFAVDIAAADFDGDGACDLTVLDYWGNMMLHQGATDPNGTPTGTFTVAAIVPAPALPPPWPAGATHPSRAMLATDLNGDGAVDLATTRQGNYAPSSGTGLVTYAGNGTFTFAAPVLHVVGAFASSLATGDLLASGNLDIAVGRTEGWTPSNFGVAAIQLGGGGSTFPSLTVGPGVPAKVVAVDFDGDGATDLMVGKEDGNLTFVPGQCVPAVPRAVAVADPNGGESIAVGTNVTLSWTKSPSVAAVDIAMSRDDGATWQTIATDVTANWLDWRVTPPGTSRGRMRVTASGHLSVFDDSDVAFEITGPELATLQVLGFGCPANGALLVTGLPILGTSVPAVVFAAPPGALGGVLFSGPIASPMPLSPGCDVWLHPAFAFLFGFVADANGQHVDSFTTPGDRALIGATFHLQGALWSSSYPSGFGLSNALALQCGY
jgi:hypothetical protein